MFNGGRCVFNVELCADACSKVGLEHVDEKLVTCVEHFH